MPLFEKKKEDIVKSKYAGMIFHLHENQDLGSKILSAKWGIRPNSFGTLAHLTGITSDVREAFKSDYDKLRNKGFYDRNSKDGVFRNHICAPNPMYPGHISSDAMMSFIRKSPNLKALSRPEPDSLMFFFDSENQQDSPLKHAAIYIKDGLSFDMESTGGKFRVHNRDDIINAYPKKNGNPVLVTRYFKLF